MCSKFARRRPEGIAASHVRRRHPEEVVQKRITLFQDRAFVKIIDIPEMAQPMSPALVRSQDKANRDARRFPWEVLRSRSGRIAAHARLSHSVQLGQRDTRPLIAERSQPRHSVAGHFRRQRSASAWECARPAGRRTRLEQFSTASSTYGRGAVLPQVMDFAGGGEPTRKTSGNILLFGAALRVEGKRCEPADKSFQPLFSRRRNIFPHWP